MTGRFSLQDASPSPMQWLKQVPWRAPDLPLEHVCAGPDCGGAAVCGYGGVWFCLRCAPEDFWPAGRVR